MLKKKNKTQQNSKRRLCGDKDERNFYIISQCRKLALRVRKTRYDWIGEVIRENEMHEILWDFEI